MKSNYDIMLISNLIEGQVLFAYSEGVMPLFLAAENERNRDKSVPQLTLTQKFSKFFSRRKNRNREFFTFDHYKLFSPGVGTKLIESNCNSNKKA